jgi:hypothetical protein
MAVEESVASGMVTEETGLEAPVEGIVLVFLEPFDIEGYGGYKRGDVATFDRRTAKALLAIGRLEDEGRKQVVKRFKEGMDLPEWQPPHQRL